MTLNIDDIHCHAIKKEDNDSYIVTHHDNDESKTHEKIDWNNGTKILFIIAMHSPKLCKINNILVIKSQYI